MIKTLRITSFLAAALAIFVFAFPMVFSIQGDPEIKELLNSPDFFERFQSADNAQTRPDSQTSPLVQQAQAFALYLNPPKTKTQQGPSTTRNSTSIPPQPRVTPKFTVLGTSYNEKNPMLSQALIDESSGQRWVRQSSTVGHLTIEEIRDGLVIVKNAQETFELTIEAKSSIASPVNVKADSPALNNQATTKGPVDIPALPQPQRPARPIQQQTSQQDTENQTNRGIEALIEKLQQYTQKAASDGNNTDELDNKEREAIMEKLISGVKTSQINDQEAEIIDDLGKTFENTQDESDSTESR